MFQKNTVFWDVMTCGLVEVCQCPTGTYFSHIELEVFRAMTMSNVVVVAPCSSEKI